MTKAQVIALIDQYITTNGNEEITGAQTNSVMKALANQDIPFGDIINKPTTLSGYGITDAYTKSASDSRYVNITGDQMTGGLGISSGVFTSPILGSSAGSSLTLRGNTTAFGLNFTANGGGNSYIQSQRFDGATTAYNILLNALGGNVGVGINGTPTERLQVNGNIGITGSGSGIANTGIISIYEANGVTRQGYVGFGSSSSSNLIIRNDVAGTDIVLTSGGQLTYSGSATFTGTVTANGFYESSDKRLKKNIAPLNYGLNEIEKIDTHTWNWKEDGKSDMGVIAQELETILPELVKTNEEGYKSVNYPKIIPLLINSIKELSNEIRNGKK